jgi:hypothetical protein
VDLLPDYCAHLRTAFSEREHGNVIVFGHEERDHAETMPDVTTDQRNGQSCYTIRVSMPQEEVARLGEVKLIPGMPVEAFVQTGDVLPDQAAARPADARVPGEVSRLGRIRADREAASAFVVIASAAKQSTLAFFLAAPWIASLRSQ